MKTIMGFFTGMATANEIEASAILKDVDYLKCGKKICMPLSNYWEELSKYFHLSTD